MLSYHLHLYLFCLIFLNPQQLWKGSNLVFSMKDVVDMSPVPLPLCPLPILTQHLILLLLPPLFVGLLVFLDFLINGFFSPVSLVATLSTISILFCYKQAMEHECW